MLFLFSDFRFWLVFLFAFRGVRAFLVKPLCQVGTELSKEDAVLRRTLWCLRASGLAEWTEESHDWHKKASSAAQYHLARFLMQLSHALAVLPPTALAKFLFETMGNN